MSPLICSFQLNDTAISLTRQASVHNVDFWQEKKKSTIAVLSCQSPGSLHEACLSCVCVVCLSPYRRLAQCSQDRTHPSLSTPVASVHGFPLRTRDSQPFWHAAMLASMQKKKTKSIRLIGASIFLFFFGGGVPSKPWCVRWKYPAGLCLIWPCPGWWLCGMKGENRWVLSRTPALLSYLIFFSLTCSQNEQKTSA